MTFRVINGDCKKDIENLPDLEIFKPLDLSFIDPPFNQGKEYKNHNDKMPEDKYWEWITAVLTKIFEKTAGGGSLYFMQREKNVDSVLKSLKESGWKFQNLIVWKKKTSAIPSDIRYGKHYQIIAFVTKGKKPKVFNKLRIDPPLPSNYSHKRENGIFVTDVWTDIRELTSGYFAGDEALRNEKGERIHKQQSPISLITRIVLASTEPNDLILDPFAGTGTTGIAAEQLNRNSILIEKDPDYARLIKKRFKDRRESDNILPVLEEYKCTENLDKIVGERVEWKDTKGDRGNLFRKKKSKQGKLFEKL